MSDDEDGGLCPDCWYVPALVGGDCEGVGQAG
jgi:hypothetical protein